MRKRSGMIKFIIGFMLVLYVTILGNGIRHSNREEFSDEIGADETKNSVSVETKTDVQTEGEVAASEAVQTEEVVTESENGKTETSEDTLVEASTEVPAEDDFAYLILQDMTLEEKVGQLFIIRPEALHPYATFLSVNDTEKYGVTGLDAEMLETLRKYQVGGVIYFRKNVIYPEQLQNFTRDMQANVKIPLFVGIDEEGGSVTRIAGAKSFDVPYYGSMEQIGATGDVDKAREAGAGIGSYLKDYGINLDFAPVADINTNPKNQVVGSRSFGSDPWLVADMIQGAIEGFHSENIMTATKHFPGHGDTNDDTHSGKVVLNKTWDELKACELVPFEAAIKANTDFVMVAHITLPNVTSDGLPASLSEELITGKLRGELGYNGLIITDSLSMGAIYYNYTAAEASVLAFKAGADMLLMPANFVEAYDAVLEAVKNGEISEERLDESVLRILRAKQVLY